MTDYSTQQIQSLALLAIFLFLFIYKIRKLLKGFGNRSLLHRNRTLKKLKRLSWDHFELLTMELFHKQGWKVKGNEKKGADGGVDIWIDKTSFTKKIYLR